jgi:hypothetical protein
MIKRPIVTDLMGGIDLLARVEINYNRILMFSNGTKSLNRYYYLRNNSNQDTSSYKGNTISFIIVVVLRLDINNKGDIMRKIDICMITSDFIPNIGGIAAHIYELSNSLSNKGHNLSVITLRTKFREEKYEKINNIDVYRIYYPKIPYFGYFIHLFLVWAELCFYMI